MKTSLELPETLWRRAKKHAVDQHQDLKAVIIAALERFLPKDKEDPR